tara:strand:- start:538 stop:723 length:186 start_codon:yes stop_codon:yes gene_type:complete
MKNYIFIKEDGSAQCFSGNWKIIDELKKGEVQENIIRVLVGSDNQDVSDYEIFYNKYGVSH